MRDTNNIVTIDDILKLYTKYSFLNMSKNDFAQLILKDINNSQVIQNASNITPKIINQEVIKLINKYLESLDVNSTYNIMNNYINKNYKTVDDVSKVRACVNDIYKFINKFNFNMDIEVYNLLVDNNDIINNYLALYFDAYLDDVKNGKHYDANYNNLFITLVDLYAEKEGIEINIDLSIDSSDYTKGKKKDIDCIKLYMDEISRYKILSKEEELELGIRIKNGDHEAVKKLVEHNLRFVVNRAKKYIGYGLNFQDLIQEGSLGLMKAAENYDYTKGYRFTTYASWWIRQKITRSIDDNSRNIRLPVHISQRVIAYKKVVEELKVRLGYEPTIEDIAFATGADEEAITALYEIVNRSDTTSMDKAINEEEDSSVGDFVADKSKNAEDYCMEDALKEDLKKFLVPGLLTNREAEVLKLRFGIDRDEAMTLEEVGAVFNVTRERVRQIEYKALKKLRFNRSFRTTMAAYLDISSDNQYNIGQDGEFKKNKSQAVHKHISPHQPIKAPKAKRVEIPLLELPKFEEKKTEDKEKKETTKKEEPVKSVIKKEVPVVKKKEEIKEVVKKEEVIPVKMVETVKKQEEVKKVEPVIKKKEETIPVKKVEPIIKKEEDPIKKEEPVIEKQEDNQLVLDYIVKTVPKKCLINIRESINQCYSLIPFPTKQDINNIMNINKILCTAIGDTITDYLGSFKVDKTYDNVYTDDIIKAVALLLAIYNKPLNSISPVADELIDLIYKVTEEGKWASILPEEPKIEYIRKTNDILKPSNVESKQEEVVIKQFDKQDNNKVATKTKPIVSKEDTKPKITTPKQDNGKKVVKSKKQYNKNPNEKKEEPKKIVESKPVFKIENIREVVNQEKAQNSLKSLRDKIKNKRNKNN